MKFTKQIFELLNIQPNEDFKIKESPNCIFRIDNNLNLQGTTKESEGFWITQIDGLDRILNGIYTIEKI